MTQPDLTKTNFIVRCMGGNRCQHAPGTCTATQSDVPTLPDWVLIEAAKRFGWDARPERLSHLRNDYIASVPYRAFCDMIAKYEQKPVDRKLLCAREAGALMGGNKAYQYRTGERDDYGDVQACIRAIELWEEGFGE